MSRPFCSTMFSSGVYLVLAVMMFSVDADIDEVKRDINQKIDESFDGNKYTLIPQFVRLVFHDCVGGCDGCINVNNPNNAGLQEAIDALETVCTYRNNHNRQTRIAEESSRADVWVLAGLEAIKRAAYMACIRRTENSKGCLYLNRPRMTFRWGRVDCPTAPYTDVERTFPNAHGDLDHVLDFFKDEFNLNTRETVALLGAHTLGHASRTHSGFQGPWVENEDHLDNQFYVDLQNTQLRWTQVDINSGTDKSPMFQWMKEEDLSGMTDNSPKNLNVDVSLLRDCQISPGGKAAVESANDCQSAETAAIFREFARNNEKWLKEFGRVYNKMAENGNTGLQSE